MAFIPLFRLFYRRAITVTIGTGVFSVSNFDGDGPRIAFDLTRSNSTTPDTGAVRIWNLNSAARQAIRLEYAATKQVRVRVSVGYEGRVKQIFDGQAFDVQPGKRVNGTDRLTQFIVGDGIDQFREGFIGASFGPGTPLDVALTAVVAAMGLTFSAGSLALFKTNLTQSIFGAMSHGLVLNGKAADTMDVLVKLVGLRWFIRDKQVVIQRTKQFFDNFAVLLTETTGLLWVSEPSFFESIQARALLNPDLQPGRQVTFRDALTGLLIGERAYSIEHVRFSGDTEGNDWLANIMEGRAIAA